MSEMQSASATLLFFTEQTLKLLGGKIKIKKRCLEIVMTDI